MILSDGELNPEFGQVPINSGARWNPIRWLIYSEIINTEITGAGPASIFTQPGKGDLLLSAGALNSLGRTLRCRFAGYVATDSEATSFTVTVLLGGTVVAATSAVPAVISSAVVPFGGDLMVTCKATGTPGHTGLVDTAGWFLVGGLSGAMSGGPFVDADPDGTLDPTTPQPVALAAALAFDVQVSSQSGNDLVVTNAVVEILPF